MRDSKTRSRASRTPDAFVAGRVDQPQIDGFTWREANSGAGTTHTHVADCVNKKLHYLVRVAGSVALAKHSLDVVPEAMSSAD